MGTIIAIGAGIAVLGALGAGIGIGIATGKAAEAIARVKCRMRVPFVTQESLFVNENLIL